MMDLGLPDFFRLLIFLVCVSCLYMLFRRYRQNRNKWNPKTLDYWFSLVMWTLAGSSVLIQGMAFNRPFTPALVFVSMAAIVSVRGLLRKGSWGGDDK